MSGFPATDTLGSMIDEVINRLQGWSQRGDQIVTLTTSIDADDLSIVLSDASSLSRGQIEIDSELIWIDSVAGSTATVPAWGRGWRSTHTDSHTAGTAVYLAPTWPRSVIAREIRNATLAVYPMLFKVGEFAFTSNSTIYQYDLDADVETILAVQWRRDSITGWRRVDGWDLATIEGNSDFPNGKVFSLLEPVPSGAEVKVTYSAIPVAMDDAADLFTATGLPASCKDVVVLGALYCLAGALDLARLGSESAAAGALAQLKPVGTATQVANTIRQQYAQRLSEERRLLLTRYQPRAHRTR